MSNFSISDLLGEADAHFLLGKQQDAGATTANTDIERSVGFVPPMLPMVASDAPEGDEWLHEIKYDGFRTQIVIDQGELRAFTKRGADWSDRYAGALIAVSKLHCSSAIIDGEMIVQDAEGRSDFEALMRALQRAPQTIVFMAFDLLHINGQDLRSHPLTARKTRLKRLIGSHDSSSRLQYVDHLIDGGESVLFAADQLGLEGIVSKRVGSRYASGPSHNWRKMKCWADEQFLVLAVERRKTGPSMALLARETRDGLSVAGWAAITPPDTVRERFWRDVDVLGCSRAEINLALDRDVQPLRPQLRVAARYQKGGDKLRHATVTEVCGA